MVKEKLGNFKEKIVNRRLKTNTTARTLWDYNLTQLSDK